MGARLRHPHFGRFDILFLRLGGADRALRVIRRNDFALEQIRLTFRVVTQEIELRLLRIGIVNGGIDLRRGQIAPRLQLGCFQLHDWLTGPQGIALPRENFLHAPAAARADMHFIHFNRAGNGVAPTSASRHRDRQRDRRDGAKQLVDVDSDEQFRLYETGFHSFSQAIAPSSCRSLVMGSKSMQAVS